MVRIHLASPFRQPFPQAEKVHHLQLLCHSWHMGLHASMSQRWVCSLGSNPWAKSSFLLSLVSYKSSPKRTWGLAMLVFWRVSMSIGLRCLRMSVFGERDFSVITTDFAPRKTHGEESQKRLRSLFRLVLPGPSENYPLAMSQPVRGTCTITWFRELWSKKRALEVIESNLRRTWSPDKWSDLL